ncbi:PREDICTED: odorant receptor 49b-like isoform X2 [Vollenhovia emeryi]|uniref:odorant receptor 49b-like isoform X2 n=1 Tax=Vollenhovia emeryi TaxID=411798 RepID=UPI0005F38398|nr:PREDICTED: odorant receptor 49b-like isoform X2 [Vollenhovia emeryi]
MSWNEDVAYAFTPYKILTLPLGVWPLQKYDTFSTVRCIACISSLSAMMIVLFLEIIFGNSEAYIKLDALMIMFCNVLSVLKLSSFRLYADNLTRNFSSAVNDYLAIDTEEKRTIMRRHAYMGRLICYSIISLAYLASSIFVLTPMIAGDKDVQANASIETQASKLPVPLPWTLGDLHISTNLFLLISMVQYILLVLNSTSDCELLKIEFTNYYIKDKSITDEFSKLTSRHRNLIEYAKLLDDVTSFVLLVQMLFSCLIICLIGFQLIIALKTHDVVMITKSITVLIALLLQLFFYSFVGDYLKCQMEEVAGAIYASNWHCLPMKVMRNVLFVIMRSQQPVQMLAGRFFVVNIKTFMAILRSSLSYLSVLRVMMET